MNEVTPNGSILCPIICAAGCAAGCIGCIADGPLIIVDAATAAPAAASAMGSSFSA